MNRLKRIFDEDPELYDRARPGYPDAIFAELTARAVLGPGRRVVEIGPGTGQATRALLRAGTRVTAVELGSGLAGHLRKSTGDPALEVEEAAFEEFEGAPEAFDGVVAFTSWHWVDRAVGARKAAELLKPDGVLATVSTLHVDGGDSQFFVRVQDCYERWDPDTPPNLRLPRADDVPPQLDEIDESVLFEPGERIRYQQDVDYNTDEYLDLMNTYSNHRALPDENRRGLFACIRRLLDDEFGGRITKRYLYELRIARRA